MFTKVFPGDLRQVTALDHHWLWEQSPLGLLVKSSKTQVKSVPGAGFAGPPPQRTPAPAYLVGTDVPVQELQRHHPPQASWSS